MLGAGSARAAAPSSNPPSLSFQDAVDRALRHNPATAEAKADVMRAQAVVEEVRASMLPTITANAVGTLLDGDRSQGAAVLQPQRSLNANLQVNIPLVVPQRWAATSHASQAVDITRFGQAETSRQLAFATAQAYLTAVLQRRLLETAERARDTAQSHYDYAHQRLTHGVGNRLDEARAEKELHDDVGRAAAVQANLERAQEALGVLVGNNGPVQPAGEVELAGLPSQDQASQAVGARSDVLLARERLSLADRVVKDSWLDFLPALSANFQPFLQTPGTVTSPSSGWQGQLVFSWQLYDGGLRYGQRREREAQRAIAQAQLEQQQRQGQSEVRAALDEIAAAEQALAEADASAKVADEVLALATEAYRAGASSNLEVIDAERNARDAEANASIARDTANQARLSLLVASGKFPGK